MIKWIFIDPPRQKGVTNFLKQGNGKVGLYMGWDMIGSGQNYVVCRYRGGESGQRLFPFSKDVQPIVFCEFDIR
jgi:hypothetical protein